MMTIITAITSVSAPTNVLLQVSEKLGYPEAWRSESASHHMSKGSIISKTFCEFDNLCKYEQATGEVWIDEHALGQIADQLGHLEDNAFPHLLPHLSLNQSCVLLCITCCIYLVCPVLYSVWVLYALYSVLILYALCYILYKLSRVDNASRS